MTYWALYLVNLAAEVLINLGARLDKSSNIAINLITRSLVNYLLVSTLCRAVLYFSRFVGSGNPDLNNASDVTCTS